MFYLVLAQVLSLLLDLLAIHQRSEQQKDLEILLLRQQLRILQRQHPTAPCISRWEKLGLAVLASNFTHVASSGKSKLVDGVLLLFKPDTVLKWHRELVRRKRTCKQRHSGGRSATDPELHALLLRLAAENPSWGYSRLHGELLKRGHTIGCSTVRDILKQDRVPPAPQREKDGSNWGSFLSHYASEITACDFFTIETVWLRTLYVFFFIELGTRQVHFAGCTAHPRAEWVTQQARQLTWTLQDQSKRSGLLIRDRDAKLTSNLDAVFQSEGMEIIRTPHRAPKANAFAERWIRSDRAECLDRILIRNEAHLRPSHEEVHQSLQQRQAAPRY
jgi:hypothetical protein